MAKAAERQRKSVDAGRRLAEHSSGDRQSLILPQGLVLWGARKAGVYVIDIVPYEVTDAVKKFLKSYCEPGDLYFERTYFNHQKIGINQDSFTCSAKCFGKPCVVCEYRIQKGVSPHKADVDLVKNLKAKERQLYLVWDHAEKHKGVQLWEVSHWAFGRNLESKINNASEKKKAKYRRFADPAEGYTLRLVAQDTAMGDGGSYPNFTVDEFTERDEPLPDEIVNHGFDLDTMVREVPYAEMQKIFLQLDDEEETAATAATARGKPADDDEDDPPPARKPATARKPADDDDDDAPPPAKTSAARKPAADDDDAPAPPRRTAAERKPKFQVGQKATFKYKNKEYDGEIERVEETREIMDIKVEGRDKPYTVDFEDVISVEPKKAAPPPDDDDPPPPKRTQAAPAPAPAKGKAAEWDDDEDAAPPARRPAKPAAPDDDDDDPPFRPKSPPKPAAAADDDDDDPPPRRPARR